MVLCERFPALEPLALGEYIAVEVFKLVRNLSAYIDRTEKGKTERATQQKAQGEKRYHMIKVTK